MIHNFYPQVYTDHEIEKSWLFLKKKRLKKSPVEPGLEESGLSSGFDRTAHFELGISNLCLDEFNIG